MFLIMCNKLGILESTIYKITAAVIKPSNQQKYIVNYAFIALMRKKKYTFKGRNKQANRSTYLYVTILYVYICVKLSLGNIILPCG